MQSLEILQQTNRQDIQKTLYGKTKSYDLTWKYGIAIKPIVKIKHEMATIWGAMLTEHKRTFFKKKLVNA
jgi:hypothetical protein